MTGHIFSRVGQGTAETTTEDVVMDKSTQIRSSEATVNTTFLLQISGVDDQFQSQNLSARNSRFVSLSIDTCCNCRLIWNCTIGIVRDSLCHLYCHGTDVKKAHRSQSISVKYAVTRLRGNITKFSPVKDARWSIISFILNMIILDVFLAPSIWLTFISWWFRRGFSVGVCKEVCNTSVIARTTALLISKPGIVARHAVSRNAFLKGCPKMASNCILTDNMFIKWNEGLYSNLTALKPEKWSTIQQVGEPELPVDMTLILEEITNAHKESFTSTNYEYINVGPLTFSF